MTKVSLLYIDDEYLNLLAFKALFRRDYTVYCANSAEEGLKKLQQNPVDFIFCDQRMPGMSGTEFLSIVRVSFPHLNRCIISGFTDDAAIRQGLKTGLIDRAFEKPYNQGSLVQYIKAATDEQVRG
ncbi:response regulator [Marispirochaeta sp.]|uniref:response regulator n=1 Tax=Marispirochaeta sp. TaxID=2038653 RepID=UPI0029C8BE82|nr:response regulator [Marispirochaeta sp.]